MRHRLAATAALGLLSACAVGGEVRLPPDPPGVPGTHPAVGKELEVILQGEDGGEAQVKPAAGRVLVGCVVVPDAPVAGVPCGAVLAAWQDRVTVIGIVEGGAPSEAAVRETTYRLFADPERRLLEKYRLEAPPFVLVTDSRGRIAAVVGPDRLDRLDRIIGRQVFGPGPDGDAEADLD